MSRYYKNILVCGGCGFMGSHFIRHLYQKYPSYRIFNLDLLTYAGNRDNLIDIEKIDKKNDFSQKRYIFIQGDIANRAFVEQLFSREKFEVVVNFAAESHVDRAIINAVEFIRTNIQGAYILIEALRLHKIPRFIYISTDEVYGDVPYKIKSAESYPLRPTNPYAASKASADLMVQAYIKTHKVPALILRSSNNYGTHQYPEKLHPLVITNLIENKIVPIHGKGNHIRSWLHVRDFCNALDLVMHKAKDYEIYNVGGEEKTTLEVVQIIFKTMKKSFKKYIKYVNDRPGPDFRYSSDDSKIKKELGWRPQFPYKDSIREIVEWYIRNKEWWQKVKKKPEFIDHYRKQVRGYYTFEEGSHYERHWTLNKVRKV